MDVSNPRGARYVTLLALAACLILIGGWLIRPRDIPQSPPVVPSETELEQLSRRTERRSLDTTARYFAGAASNVEAAVVRLESFQVSGIAWDQQRLITPPLHGWRGPGIVKVAAKQGGGDAQPTLWGPHLPFSALDAPQGLPGLTPARQAKSLPPIGDWIVAVWRTDRERAFAVGNLRQSAPMTCGVSSVEEVVSSLSFTRTMAGGGVFDIDGGLLAVILPCEDRLAAIATTSIRTLLEHEGTIDGRLGRAGLRVGPLAAEEKNYFKAVNGLLVRDVWSGYAGDDAGFRPGDIITGLNGQPVAETDDLRPFTAASDRPFDVAVQRGSRTLTIALRVDGRAAPALMVPADAGLVWDSPPRTHRVDAVIPGSRAALAGLRPGDRLVRIDGAEPRNLDQVKRTLAGPQPSPTLLEIERGGRRLAIVVP